MLVKSIYTKHVGLVHHQGNTFPFCIKDMANGIMLVPLRLIEAFNRLCVTKLLKSCSATLKTVNDYMQILILSRYLGLIGVAMS